LLFLPPPALAGCVFAAIYRDTRGADLSHWDRFNHFPASPLVSVTRVWHGKLEIVPQGDLQLRRSSLGNLPTTLILGPQDRPVTSWSPDEVGAISVGVFHDAWLRLGGEADFHGAPPGFLPALDGFAAAGSPEAGWEVFCSALTVVWQRQRPRTWTTAMGLGDWAQAAVVRAMTGTAGRSLRSVERRLKRTSGQTRRTMDFFSRFETLEKVSRQHPDSPLADIAYAAGFADQSHMGRAVRRATGLTPAQLNKAIQTEEAFWCYRLLGERF
jgi:AraC-like DNA-binding protein